MTDSFTLTWDEYAKIAPLGLVLGEPTIEEDSHGNLSGITFPILSATEKAMEALKSKKPKLTAILENMLNAARATPGVVQRKSLASGLSIDLIAGIDGMLRIQIYRDKGKYPSPTEWATMTKYFPVALEERNPERFTANGRGYMRAAWEMPR